MNFLAHYRLVRPASPDYVIGNALPDLLPLASPRARLRLSRLPFEPENDLLAGVKAHLLADIVFHQSAAFSFAKTEMKNLIGEADFKGIRIRSFFLAHLLVELLLDHVLLLAEPGLAADFYQCFALADFERVAHWTEQKVAQPLPSLPFVLNQFLQKRYLEDYRDERVLAHGISVLCADAHQDHFAGANWACLETLIHRAIPLIEELAPSLMSD